MGSRSSPQTPLPGRTAKHGSRKLRFHSLPLPIPAVRCAKADQTGLGQSRSPFHIARPSQYNSLSRSCIHSVIPSTRHNLELSSTSRSILLRPLLLLVCLHLDNCKPNLRPRLRPRLRTPAPGKASSLASYSTVPGKLATARPRQRPTKSHRCEHVPRSNEIRG